MIPTRSRAIENTTAFRKLIQENPSYGKVRVNLQTLVEYCEALMSTDSRIPVRYRRDGGGR